MLKLSLWRGIAALLLPLLVSACGGGSSAPPPTGGITVVSGNGQAFVSWTADPGVDYWVVYAPTSSVASGQALTGSSVHLWANNGTAVTSPLQITGLTNGTSYSFAINGRVSGGVGGAFSPVQATTPRPAGANWIAGTGTAATSDLHGLAFGTSSADSLNYYLAVGDNGAMYKGLDGVAQSLNGYSWTAITAPVTSPFPTVNYKAAIYMFSRYIAVGDGGVGGGANSIVSGTDLATWTAAAWASGTSAPSGAINALASNGSALVAVGNGGAVYYTGDGITWAAANTLPTTANLYGVAYSPYTAMWIAVGAGGALLTSTDAITWTAGNSGVASTIALRGVAATTGNVVVAVGDNGTIITNSTMTTTNLIGADLQRFYRIELR